MSESQFWLEQILTFAGVAVDDHWRHAATLWRHGRSPWDRAAGIRPARAGTGPPGEDIATRAIEPALAEAERLEQVRGDFEAAARAALQPVGIEGPFERRVFGWGAYVFVPVSPRSDGVAFVKAQSSSALVAYKNLLPAGPAQQ